MTTDNEGDKRVDVDIPFAMLPFEDTKDSCKAKDGEEDKPEKKSTTSSQGLPVCEAILNLLSDMIGTGLLALPYVILKGGLMAILSMILLPLICYYTGKILIECLYEKNIQGKSIRVRSSYRDIAEACWERLGGIVAVTIQTAQLVLLASSYIVLSASLMSHILQDMHVSERLWILIAALVGLPMTFAKNLSQVAWLSLLSIAALFAAAFVITGYGYSNSRPWDVHELPLWDTEGVPLAISIVTFSYVAHGALPSIEDSMADRSKFKIMLAATYLFSALLRTSFAINGFFSFHDNIKEIISNSLPRGAVRITVNALLVAYSILCYPFVGITIIHIAEHSIASESRRAMIPARVWYVLARLVLTLTTVTAALLVPHFAVLIAISGNLAGCIAFILPCLFHLRLKISELTVWNIILDYVLLAIGISTSIIGMVFAILELIAVY